MSNYVMGILLTPLVAVVCLMCAGLCVFIALAYPLMALVGAVKITQDEAGKYSAKFRT